MGSAASKGARRLPKNVPTAAHPSPAMPRPPPEALRSQPEAPQASQTGRELNYGRQAAGTPKASDAPFSGEKDDNIMRDAMDPQFLANLQKLGPVNVPDPGNLRNTQSRAQRTLSARKKEYTSPTAVPPPGTVTMAMMGELLDTLKTLPAGSDPAAWYAHYGLKGDDMAAVRRWVNSPSVGEDETVHITEGMNHTVEQQVEMKAVWIDGKDKGARKI